MLMVDGDLGGTALCVHQSQVVSAREVSLTNDQRSAKKQLSLVAV